VQAYAVDVLPAAGYPGACTQPVLTTSLLLLAPPYPAWRLAAETAARDRVGRGHTIEIKPLSSILDRIKQRQALAIARCGLLLGRLGGQQWAG